MIHNIILHITKMGNHKSCDSVIKMTGSFIFTALLFSVNNQMNKIKYTRLMCFKAIYRFYISFI